MKNLFTFNSRANRAKYIWYPFLAIIPWLALGFIQFLTNNSNNTLTNILVVLAYLPSIPISTCILVQRLHDIDRPGTHYWLCLIPIYNIYMAFLLLFKKGTDGPNQYGEDPLGIKEIA